MELVGKIFLMLVCFQVKHFVCDYPLQGKYMLGKFNARFKDYIGPLVAHSGVHAIGSFAIVYLFTARIDVALMLGGLDLVAHGTMDRIKASPKLLGIFSPDQSRFWWSLGFDQMVHHLTHYLIVWIVLSL